MSKSLQALLLAYSQPAGWEESFYRALRIGGFAQFTPAVLWRRLMGGEPHHRIQSRADLLPYCKETLISEGGHLFSLAGMLAATGYFYANGQLLIALSALIANVGINLLPIFLMRHNRIRIANLMDISERAMVAKAISSGSTQ